jgi:hypothetical protein
VKTLLQTAIVLAAAGAVLSLWLFSGVNWVNFFFFMVLVQPLFVAAFLLFAIAVVRDIAHRRAT